MKVKSCSKTLITLAALVAGVASQANDALFSTFTTSYKSLSERSHAIVESGEKSAVYKSYLKEIAALEKTGRALDSAKGKNPLLKSISFRSLVSSYKKSFSKLDTDSSRTIISLNLSKPFTLYSFDETVGDFKLAKFNMKQGIKAFQKYSKNTNPSVDVVFEEYTQEYTDTLNELKNDSVVDSVLDLVAEADYQTFIEKTKQMNGQELHNCGYDCRENTEHVYVRTVEIDSFTAHAKGVKKVIAIEENTPVEALTSDFVLKSTSIKYVDASGKTHKTSLFRPESKMINKHVKRQLKNQLNHIKTYASRSRTKLKKANIDSRIVSREINNALNAINKYDANAESIRKYGQQLEATSSALTACVNQLNTGKPSALVSIQK